MKNRAITLVAALVSAFVSLAAARFAGQKGCEIPFRFEGHLMIVDASIGRMNGLRFMIDTAATGSVIDRNVIKTLGLKPQPWESSILVMGRTTKTRPFQVPLLQIGPVIATLPCHQADLGGLGVDGIIGIDLLRQQIPLTHSETNEVIRSRSFTIDFKKRTLHFGLRQELEHTAPVESSAANIIVTAMIQGRPQRLAVDTASYTIILYGKPRVGWLEARGTIESTRFLTLGGTNQGKPVILTSLELGSSRWTYLSGLLLDLPGQAKDGLLPVKPLGLKILHFDFDRNLMSWTK